MLLSTVPANGVRLHVEHHAGDSAAPTLVFAHAFGASSRTWHRVAEALAGAAPCAMPDLRGWGASEATDAGYAVADMADDLEALVAALRLERWALVGHSMGGKAATALAARRPAGLEALVLVAPSPPTPEPMDDAERARLRSAWGDPEAAEVTLSKVTACPPPPVPHEQFVADAVRASRAAWMAWLDAGSREDVSDLAGQIAVPTLVVAGADDGALGPDVQARETVARIPGARLETLPHAGHFVPLDAPARLAELIAGHVPAAGA